MSRDLELPVKPLCEICGDRGVMIRFDVTPEGARRGRLRPCPNCKSDRPIRHVWLPVRQDVPAGGDAP